MDVSPNWGERLIDVSWLRGTLVAGLVVEDEFRLAYPKPLPFAQPRLLGV